jgi:amino acid adenylation domain-containing protein
MTIQTPDCVHLRFEAQARRTPEAVAVEYEGQRTTYSELNARANQVAWYLRERGVGPEVLVALALERSPQALVALIGVLKAGGAYVPVDPLYPTARRSFMLRDSGAAVALAGQSLTEVPNGTTVIRATPEAAPWSSAPTTDPPNFARPQNLAYVIYTSGSTGQPKGVAIQHRGLCRLAGDQIQRWSCGPGSRVLQFASPSFDACFTEIAVALLSGATLCLAPPCALMPGAELRRTLRRLRITAVKTPPSVLAITPDHDLPDLRLVVNGGGALHADLVRRWSPGRTFLNAYGATECSVCSTTTPPLLPGDRITLGEPVAGTVMRVLDADLQPLPGGQAGEVFIAGAGVGRGYWQRPDLTAERFLPDPSGPPGSRLYRTGDLARLAGGPAEYVGRVDQQVKVRGFRIELGEVERALVAHHAVLEATASVAGQAGDERLVAHVVLKEGGEVTGLRAFLGDRLPGYMIPSMFVRLEHLPLTPNGKVDRAALPPPPSERPDLESEYVGPATPVQRLLVGIWSEILGVEPVGVRDNFFDLGGDSLRAAAVIDRLRQDTGSHVPLYALLVGPTVAELAEAVEPGSSATADREA